MSTDLESRLRATFERHLEGVDVDVSGQLALARTRLRRRRRTTVGLAVAAAAAVLAGAVGVGTIVAPDDATRPLPGRTATSSQPTPTEATAVGLAGTWYLQDPPTHAVGAPVGELLVGATTEAGGILRVSWTTLPCRVAGSVELDGQRVTETGGVVQDPPPCTPDPAETRTADAWGGARAVVLTNGRLLLLGSGGSLRATFTDTPPAVTPLPVRGPVAGAPDGLVGGWETAGVRWWDGATTGRYAPASGLVVRSAGTDRIEVTVDGACRVRTWGLLGSGFVATREDGPAVGACTPGDDPGSLALGAALDLTASVGVDAAGTLVLLDRHGEALVLLTRRP